MIVSLMTTTCSPMTATLVASGATTYSNSIEIQSWSGFTALLVTIVASGSPSVTISQQCSNDNSTWYDPVDSSGNALSSIATAITTSKYIVFDPSIARFVRFKVVAAADSTVSLNFVYRE